MVIDSIINVKRNVNEMKKKKANGVEMFLSKRKMFEIV